MKLALTILVGLIPGLCRAAVPSPVAAVVSTGTGTAASLETSTVSETLEELDDALLEDDGLLVPEPLVRDAEAVMRELDRIHPLEPDPNWLPDLSYVPPLRTYAIQRRTIIERWKQIGTSTAAGSFDIPITDDPRVDQWLSHLQGRGRKRFTVWMSRLTRWAPVFIPVLERHQVPHDLIFLAMVESGLSPRAYSWAHAAGPWQFIPTTGRRYGLQVGFWVDERRDFERSADAAARYLKNLHRTFEDWWLAWAAYNAGPGRVRRAIRRTGTTDFWRISRTRHLRRETKHYVPKIIAAAIVSKNPELFGFDDVPYLEPIDWEVVTVTVSTDLATIAKACGEQTTEDELRLLNPALYRGITPPKTDYALRVPLKRGFACVEGLRAMDPDERRAYRYHPIRRGDTVERIAEIYGTSKEEILTYSKITAGKLRMFDGVIVPIPFASDPIAPVFEIRENWRAFPPFTPGSGMVLVHRVRPGDSLWRIARRYRVSIRKLRSWNGLRSNLLRVGQKIRIRRGS